MGGGGALTSIGPQNESREIQELWSIIGTLRSMTRCNSVVLIIYLNKKSFLKFDNCNNDGLEACLHVSNLQTTTFDNTLSSCCVVNLKVSIIRGGGAMS